MHLDPSFQEFSIVFLVLFLSGALAKVVGLPNTIGFLLSGIIVGPSVLNIVHKASAINQVGSAGVVLLLFFVGIELSPKELIKDWKINVVGTLFQIVFSVLSVFVLGNFLGWSIARIVLLGFVISLSSTSMVIQMLNENKQINSRLGKDVLGILITQDILIVPMLIVIGLLGVEAVNTSQLFKQLVGGSLLIILLVISPFFAKKKHSFFEHLAGDKELALLFCLSFAFTLALLSGLFELSTAMGAFVAGSIVGQFKLGHIFEESLGSIKILLMAVFFSCIGLQLELSFLMKAPFVIMGMTLLALITNTFLNAIILRVLGRDWKTSFLTASYLAQIGEFSFMLAAIGLNEKIVTDYVYQITAFTVFFSIVLTPVWIKMFSLLTKANSQIEKQVA